MRKFCKIFLLTVFPLSFFGQKNSGVELYKEHILELFLEIQEDENIDISLIEEQLFYFFENPISLNTSNYEDLASIPLLSHLNVIEIIDHRRKYGLFRSVFELQMIASLTNEKRVLLRHFVRIEESELTWRFKEEIKNIEVKLSQGFAQQIQNREGFLNGEFEGSKAKLYTRIELNANQNIKLKYIYEKDPGERGSNGFNTLNLEINRLKHFEKIVVGDYQLQFGQGLSMGSGFAPRKSSLLTSAKQVPFGLRSNGSVNENRYFRGLASHIKLDDFGLIMFISKNCIDANIDSDGKTQIITSFNSTGLHRTTSEIDNFKSVSQSVIGSNIRLKKTNYSLGFSGVYNHYNLPVEGGKYIYNQLQKDTNASFVYGVDGSFIYRNINAYGEFSQSDNGAVAYLFGTLIFLDPKLSLSVLYRNYAKDYQNSWSSAFGKSTLSQNEKGLFISANVKINEAINFTTYIDRSKTDWLTFNMDSPGYFNELMFQFNYKPSKYDLVYMRYSWKENSSSNEEALQLSNQILESKKSLRLNADYGISKSLKLKSRIEFNNVNESVGMLMFQDITFKKMEFPISLSLRYAVFDSDNYTNRIYAYEKTLPYNYMIPAYAYQGTRSYLLVKYKHKRFFSAWIQLSKWHFANRTEISSGNNKINGSDLTELKIQLQWKFKN